MPDKCSRCNTEPHPGALFCHKCGGRLESDPMGVFCHKCGKNLPVDATFCLQCGSRRPDQPVPETVPPGSVPPAPSSTDNTLAISTLAPPSTIPLGVPTGTGPVLVTAGASNVQGEATDPDPVSSQRRLISEMDNRERKKLARDSSENVESENDASAAMDVLMNLVYDSNAQVREAAVKSIKKIAEVYPDVTTMAVPPLLERTTDRDKFTRIEALKALGTIARQSERTVLMVRERIFKALMDEDAGVRYRAVAVVGELAPEHGIHLEFCIEPLEMMASSDTMQTNRTEAEGVLRILREAQYPDATPARTGTSQLGNEGRSIIENSIARIPMMQGPRPEARPVHFTDTPSSSTPAPPLAITSDVEVEPPAPEPEEDEEITWVHHEENGIGGEIPPGIPSPAGEPDQEPRLVIDTPPSPEQEPPLPSDHPGDPVQSHPQPSQSTPLTRREGGSAGQFQVNLENGMPVYEEIDPGEPVELESDEAEWIQQPDERTHETIPEPSEYPSPGVPGDNPVPAGNFDHDGTISQPDDHGDPELESGEMFEVEEIDEVEFLEELDSMLEEELEDVPEPCDDDDKRGGLRETRKDLPPTERPDTRDSDTGSLVPPAPVAGRKKHAGPIRKVKKPVKVKKVKPKVIKKKT